MENSSTLVNDDGELEIKIESPDIEIEDEIPIETLVQNKKRLMPMYVSNTQTFNLWTSKATACLIGQYKKYRSLVGQTNQFRSLRDMFDTISLEMQKHGYFFSPQKCENKWRVLERKYKNLVVREQMRKPGRIKHYGHWEHKKALDEIFTEKKRASYLLDNEIAQSEAPTNNAPTLPNSSSTTSQPQKPVNGHGRNLAVDEDPLALTSNASISSNEETESVESRYLSIEKMFSEIKKLVEISEDNNERRHDERMSIYQDQLKIQKRLLEIEEQKLNLQKRKLLAMVQSFQGAQ